MPTSVPEWDPLEVLKIENILTCSGWAHSKGRKCYNRIAKENRELATEIMEDMALLDVRSANFKASLRSLAKPLLCRAYHVKDPDQHTALRRQWGKHIDAYKLTVNARRTRAARPRRSASVTVESLQEEVESLRATMALLVQRTAEPARVERDPSVTSSTHPPQNSHVHHATSSDNERQRALLVQRTAEQARVEHGPSVVSSNPPRQTSRVHQATSPDNERPTVQPEADRSQPLRPVSVHSTRNVAVNAANSTSRDSASTEGDRPRELRSTTTPPPSENTEAGSSRPTSHLIPEPTAPEHPNETVPCDLPQPTTTNVPPLNPDQEPSHPETDRGRRAIEGDCSICCEDLHSGENISWCKAQCGQNFHADCVGVWLATLTEGPRTCPCCRVSWVD